MDMFDSAQRMFRRMKKASRFRTFGFLTVYMAICTVAFGWLLYMSPRAWELRILFGLTLASTILTVSVRSVRDFERLTPAYGVFAWRVYKQHRVLKGVHVFALQLAMRDLTEENLDGFDALYADIRHQTSPIQLLQYELRTALEPFGPYPEPSVLIEPAPLTEARKRLLAHIPRLQSVTQEYRVYMEAKIGRAYSRKEAMRLWSELQEAISVHDDLKEMEEELQKPLTPTPRPRWTGTILGNIISLDDARSIREMHDRLRDKGGELSAA